MPSMSAPPSAAGPTSRTARLAAFLRREPVGGFLLLAATLIALAWANSPLADSYFALRDTAFGPSALHLDLTAGAWATDGLLAILFFVVGLELKREFVHGDLRDPRRALVPIAAAVGGLVVPALVYLTVALATGADAVRGWAIPTATDFAFAVAVLAVVGRGLPPAVRTFLLTLAVVDDLIAITIIAIGYTTGLAALPLLMALLPLAAFAALTHRGITAWWLLTPLAILTWALIHTSGVHATVAGVMLGMVVPAHDLAERFERRIRPISTGLAVPIFALLSAGVSIGSGTGLIDSLATPVALGIIGGLVVGKTGGVLAATFLATRLPGARLDPTMRWADVAAIAPLTGVGFTVALLVGDLAFGTGSAADDDVKIGVLCGSLAAAALGGGLLLHRARTHRRRTAAQTGSAAGVRRARRPSSSSPGARVGSPPGGWEGPCGSVGTAGAGRSRRRP